MAADVAPCGPLPAKQLYFYPIHLVITLGQVVESIVSLKSWLKCQLVCFTTLYANTLVFFVEQMREAFAMKSFSFFNFEILAYFRF